MSDRLARLIESAGSPSILVVGDLMLDRYVWGEARRISGEGRVTVSERRSIASMRRSLLLNAASSRQILTQATRASFRTTIRAG